MNVQSTQETQVKPAPYDYASAMFAWEDGALDEDETLKLFQYLVDTGLTWSLQGFYGRQAAAFLNAGLISPQRN